MSARCQEMVALAITRSLGVLEDREEEELARHLESCSTCRELGVAAEAGLARDPEISAARPSGSWEELRSAFERPARSRPVTIKVACTYCHGDLGQPGVVYCATCLAPCHSACFEEHGRCPALGCPETRTVVARDRREGARAEPAIRLREIPRERAPVAPRSRWRAALLLLSSVATAVAAAVAGFGTLAVAERELDDQITQRGVTAVESFEKGLDKAFWVCPTDRIREGLSAASIVDPQPAAIGAFWSGLKVHLQKSFNDSLDRLAKGSGGQILFASLYEGEPTSAVALSSERAVLSGVRKLATVGRVEVYEGSVQGRRTRRFDAPILGTDGRQVIGSGGLAFVSIYVDAEELDEVPARNRAWIVGLVAAGLGAGVLVTLAWSSRRARA